MGESKAFWVLILYILVRLAQFQCYHHTECRCCTANLPPCRPPPGRSVVLQTFPLEDLQHCRLSPIFVKFRILIFRYIEKRVSNHNERLYMQYLTFKDKTIIFSYVNDESFFINLWHLRWIYKDKTSTVEMVSGEGLQCFFSTITDLPGEVCNGGKVCNITPVLYCRPSPLQTFSPGRSATLKTFPRTICNNSDLPQKICNIADLHPWGKVCNIADLPPFIAELPRRIICNIADLPPFCKVLDSHFPMYRKKRF